MYLKVKNRFQGKLTKLIRTFQCIEDLDKTKCGIDYNQLTYLIQILCDIRYTMSYYDNLALCTIRDISLKEAIENAKCDIYIYYNMSYNPENTYSKNKYRPYLNNCVKLIDEIESLLA